MKLEIDTLVSLAWEMKKHVFGIDAAGAHKPEKSEQWIFKSTPMLPIARQDNFGAWISKLSPVVPIAHKIQIHGFRNRCRWPHKQHNLERSISKSTPFVPLAWKKLNYGLRSRRR
jgi:hypothetical protein